MSGHKLDKDFAAILKPLKELPDAKPGQSILVVESDPESPCGFAVEEYQHASGLRMDVQSKGWSGDPFELFHECRGDQKDRIVGWVWVTK